MIKDNKRQANLSVILNNLSEGLYQQFFRIPAQVSRISDILFCKSKPMILTGSRSSSNHRNKVQLLDGGHKSFYCKMIFVIGIQSLTLVFSLFLDEILFFTLWRLRNVKSFDVLLLRYAKAESKRWHRCTRAKREEEAEWIANSAVHRSWVDDQSRKVRWEVDECDLGQIQ